MFLVYSATIAVAIKIVNVCKSSSARCDTNSNKAHLHANGGLKLGSERWVHHRRSRQDRIDRLIALQLLRLHLIIFISSYLSSPTSLPVCCCCCCCCCRCFSRLDASIRNFPQTISAWTANYLYFVIFDV